MNNTTRYVVFNIKINVLILQWNETLVFKNQSDFNTVEIINEWRNVLKVNFYLIRLRGMLQICFEVIPRESHLHSVFYLLNQRLRGYWMQLKYQHQCCHRFRLLGYRTSCCRCGLSQLLKLWLKLRRLSLSFRCVILPFLWYLKFNLIL